MLLLTRRYSFSAAHQLNNPDWNETQNIQFFGACARLHGHTYQLEITLTGEVDRDTGMLIDLRQFDALVQKFILDAVDHQHLDHDVDFIHGHRSTVEVLTRLFFDRLAPVFSENSTTLYRVRLYESPDNWAETTLSGNAVI